MATTAPLGSDPMIPDDIRRHLTVVSSDEDG
jgi:hypothetical protein